VNAPGRGHIEIKAPGSDKFERVDILEPHQAKAVIASETPQPSAPRAPRSRRRVVRGRKRSPPRRRPRRPSTEDDELPPALARLDAGLLVSDLLDIFCEDVDPDEREELVESLPWPTVERLFWKAWDAV